MIFHKTKLEKTVVYMYAYGAGKGQYVKLARRYGWRRVNMARKFANSLRAYSGMTTDHFLGKKAMYQSGNFIRLDGEIQVMNYHNSKGVF